MDDPCELLAQWLATARRGVVFTGAGVSTESGIPDFRSPGGVWATSRPVYYDDFVADAGSRAEYWRQKSLAHDDIFLAKPNEAHRAFSRWEAVGIVRGTITQNIDGLHQLAGSRKVLELHGTAREVACLDCTARFDADDVIRRYREHERAPDCPHCRGPLKHATISFGQALDPGILRAAAAWAREADLFLALGSSLVVEPAASLPLIALQSGARLVIVNRGETPLDEVANLVINDGIGVTVTAVEELLHPDEDE